MSLSLASTPASTHDIEKATLQAELPDSPCYCLLPWSGFYHTSLVHHRRQRLWIRDGVRNSMGSLVYAEESAMSVAGCRRTRRHLP